MADLLWSSGGSTSFSTPANWVNLATGVAYGSALASNDKFIFRAGSSTVAPITGLNNTALTGCTIIIEPGWDYNIGEDGNPLIISSAYIIHEGNATLYIQDGDGTTSDIEIAQRSKIGTAAKLYGNGWSRVHCTMGTTVLAATAVVTTLEIGYKNNPNSDAVVSNLVGSTVVDVMQNGGISTFDAIEITDFYMSGGVCNYSDSSYGSKNVDDLFMSGGILNYNSNTALTRAFVAGGTLDLTKTAAPKTVSYAAEYGTGRILYRPGVDTLTTYRLLGSKGKS